MQGAGMLQPPANLLAQLLMSRKERPEEVEPEKSSRLHPPKEQQGSSMAISSREIPCDSLPPAAFRLQKQSRFLLDAWAHCHDLNVDIQPRVTLGAYKPCYQCLGGRPTIACLIRIILRSMQHCKPRRGASIVAHCHLTRLQAAKLI
ncbi:hypothetical protein H0G86_002217 [Trichoderma simmonsii]|uniref:Uncharacterized protein n=1 Tax=Trichoderma simmonsii TaxID=1491479 RepID=A0A8G0L672_9HYPO|nr:hypothetical protein H0G86_002217 [Trichoderma simmonsii]